MILITGGTGFVGSALATHLAHLNQPVRALCRRAPNPTDQLVEYVSGVDLLSNPDLRSLLKDVSSVVHTAARVHVMNEDSRDPLGSFRAMNVDATLSLARQTFLYRHARGARLLLLVRWLAEQAHEHARAHGSVPHRHSILAWWQ